MNNWLYKGKEIKEISDLDKILKPLCCFGFVYEITTPIGQKYVGRKNLFSRQNVKIGKKELVILKEERKLKGMRGRAPVKKLVTKESDWQFYWSSNKPLLKAIKEDKYVGYTREILQLAYNKKHLTYLENKYLFQLEVLEKPTIYLNDNIQGRFFTKDLQDVDFWEDN